MSLTQRQKGPIPRTGYLKRKLFKIPGTLSYDDHKGKINFIISLPIPRTDHVKRRFSYNGAHLYVDQSPFEN